MAADKPLVPTELFELASLREVLNMDMWRNVLTEADQERLLRFLPPGADDELVQVLLDGQRAMGFDTPVPRLFSQMQAGDLHPRARKYPMGAAMLRQCMQIIELRNYHNALVARLLAVAAAQRPHVPSEGAAAQTA